MEMILMGVLATLFMDLSALVLGRLKVIRPLIGPEAVGRWAIYMLRGKFVHEDIRKTPALKNEKEAAFLAHYVIGIALAGIFLFLEWQAPAIFHQFWMPVLFGIATTILPWFWLYPSIGLGFIASKAPARSPYIVTSLVNHTNFGLGLVIWVVVLRGLLM